MKNTVIEATNLVGHKIKLDNCKCVKVITTKITEDGILLIVEENVDGKLKQYEVNYENNMIPL